MLKWTTICCVPCVAANADVMAKKPKAGQPKASSDTNRVKSIYQTIARKKLKMKSKGYIAALGDIAEKLGFPGARNNQLPIQSVRQRRL